MLSGNLLKFRTFPSSIRSNPIQSSIETQKVRKDTEIEIEKQKMLMGLVSLQSIMDLVLAGISLMIGLGIFAFIASVLCSAAFFQHAKDVFA